MNQSHKKRLAKGICATALAALMFCSTLAFAGPTFESVTFGKLSTHCEAKNTLVNIVPDGSGISLQFGNLQARAGMNAVEPNRVRCDLSLKLAEPLEAPASIQAGVSGLLQLAGHGAASASISLNGHKQRLRFDAKDADGFDRVTVTLPKGVNKLDISFEAVATSESPNSTALVAIDSLDVEIERGK